jgi:hypothetical protein
MNESRRQLLILGAMTAASVTLPIELFGQAKSQSAAPPSPPTESEYDVLATLTAADFQPFVGAVFHTKSQNAAAVRLTLVEVQSPPSSVGIQPAAPGAYALRFKSVSGPALPQDTYVFINGGLPHFAMFIVPSGAVAKSTYYTGQINRSV